MISALSPCAHHYEDTHNTLKYANRAKEIKTKARPTSRPRLRPRPSRVCATLRSARGIHLWQSGLQWGSARFHTVAPLHTRARVHLNVAMAIAAGDGKRHERQDARVAIQEDHRGAARAD